MTRSPVIPLIQLSAESDQVQKRREEGAKQQALIAAAIAAEEAAAAQERAKLEAGFGTKSGGSSQASPMANSNETSTDEVNHNNNQPQIPDVSNPVASLKALAEGFVGKQIAVGELDDYNNLNYEAVGQVRFDVKQSDSLVSPYTGYVYINVVGHNKLGTQKTIHHLQFDYAYQQNKWNCIATDHEWEYPALFNGREKNSFRCLPQYVR